MTSPTPSPETAEAISEELLNETEIVATASAFVYGGRLLLSRDEVMLMAKCLVQFGNRLEKVAPAYERLYLDKGKDEAEIAALKAERAWRPIETARNAGHRRFLCWNSRYGIRIGTVVDRADHDDWLSYMDAWGGSSKGGVRATHWLPLPAPPAEETDNG